MPGYQVLAVGADMAERRLRPTGGGEIRTEKLLSPGTRQPRPDRQRSIAPGMISTGNLFYTSYGASLKINQTPGASLISVSVALHYENFGIIIYNPMIFVNI